MKLVPLIAAAAFTMVAGTAAAEQKGAGNLNGVFQSQSGNRNLQVMDIASIDSATRRVSTNVTGGGINQMQTGELNRQRMQIGSVVAGGVRSISTDIRVRDVLQAQTGLRNDQLMRIGVVH